MPMVLWNSNTLRLRFELEVPGFRPLLVPKSLRRKVRRTAFYGEFDVLEISGLAAPGKVVDFGVEGSRSAMCCRPDWAGCAEAFWSRDVESSLGSSRRRSFGAKASRLFFREELLVLRLVSRWTEGSRGLMVLRAPIELGCGRISGP
jgi:hypothetical protein